MIRPSFHWNTIVRFILRFSLGCLFLYAAFSKLAWTESSLGIQDFAQSVANFRMDAISMFHIHLNLLPSSFVPLFSIVILAMEVLVGILLIFGIWEKEVTFIAALLFILFGIAIISVIDRGIQIDCGCFGTGPSPANWTNLFLKDILPFISTVILLILIKFKPQGLASSRSHDNS